MEDILLTGTCKTNALIGTGCEKSESENVGLSDLEGGRVGIGEVRI